MKISAISSLRSSFFLGAIAAICSFATQAQAQTTIYQDTFSGAATDDLGARIPDVSTTGDGWLTAFSRQNDGTDNDSVQIFNADGSIVKDGPNPTHDAGALLPLEIEANAVYTLEATFLNNNSSWIAVGFASSTIDLDGSNGRHSNGGPADAPRFGGYAWALSRNNSGTDQEFFNGIGTDQGPAGFVGGVNGGDFANPTAPVNIRIVLDTADTAAITAEYFLNGTQIGGTQTLDPAAFDNIGFVGISSDGNVGDGTATISSFSLTAVTADVLRGDVNLSTTVDFADIAPFIAILSASDFQPEADVDGNGMVDFADIAPFIAILSGS